MSDSTVKFSVEDRLDIMELFAKYAWGINTGDIEAVLGCFADDGYLDHLWQGKLEGRDKSAARSKSFGTTARAGGSAGSIWRIIS